MDTYVKLMEALKRSIARMNVQKSRYVDYNDYSVTYYDDGWYRAGYEVQTIFGYRRRENLIELIY